MTERIDITKPVKEICNLLDLDPNYVARINLAPGEAEITLFKGRDGRCKGTKYVDADSGKAATETLSYRIRP